MKRLIINADDFGFTSDVNAGIVHAHREGVLTSTTLMANGDAFDEAVALAIRAPTLDVGCHLVLVQGRSLLTGKKLPESPTALLVSLMRGELDAYRELHAQIEKILSAGIRPSHLDTHKHTHILPQVFATVVRLAQEFHIPFVRLPFDETLPFSRIPLRALGAIARSFAARRGIQSTDHFMGFRLTGSLNEASFSKALKTLPEGTTEFMCHPGFLREELQNAPTRLKQSRVTELEALVSPRVREILRQANVELSSFAVLATHRIETAAPRY